MSRDAIQLLVEDVQGTSGMPVTIIARFDGTDYRLGRTVPTNPVSIELVELLRYLAGEIEQAQQGPARQSIPSPTTTAAAAQVEHPAEEATT